MTILQTAMIVRVLVIFYKLTRTAKEFLADPSSFDLYASHGHYTNVFSFEEITGLGNVFNTYLDRNSDGIVSSEQLHTLMNTLGVNMTQEEADSLAKAIIEAEASFETAQRDDIKSKRTAAGKLGLTREVFFQWYASQLSHHNDKKECADYLFGMFDRDDSGDITVLEFKQSLDALAFGISHDESDELLEELDQDGNGVLCANEFEEMVEHFWPLEFKDAVG